MKKENIVTGISVVSQVIGYLVPRAQSIHDVIQRIQQRRSKKQFERLEQFVNELNDKVKLDRSIEEKEVDLIEEILAAAVQEEEKEKAPIYVALVDIYLQKKLESAVVRLLIEALKTLTVYELDEFVKFSHGGTGPKKEGFLGEIFWQRLQALGLDPGGVHMRDNITAFGRLVIEVVEASRKSEMDS